MGMQCLQGKEEHAAIEHMFDNDPHRHPEDRTLVGLDSERAAVDADRKAVEAERRAIADAVIARHEAERQARLAAERADMTYRG